MKKLLARQIAEDLIDQSHLIGIRSWTKEDLDEFCKLALLGLKDEATTIWTCFFCDETFTDREAAAEHFGGELTQPACKLNATEGGIVGLFRHQYYELHKYRQEETAMVQEVSRLCGEHYLAVQRAEEAGYARGIQDAKVLSRAIKMIDDAVNMRAVPHRSDVVALVKQATDLGLYP